MRDEPTRRSDSSRSRVRWLSRGGARENSARFVGRSFGCIFSSKVPIEIALDG